MVVKKPATGIEENTEQVMTTVKITVRVPNNISGTLFEAVTDLVNRIQFVTSFKVDESIDLHPKNGVTYVTVRGELTVTGVSTRSQVITEVGDPTFIEDIELVEDTGIT